MRNEKQLLDLEEIKKVFKSVKKTQDLEVLNIEYKHYDLFPDYYEVYTNKAVYGFNYDTKSNWKGRRNYGVYPRIVKLRK